MTDVNVETCEGIARMSDDLFKRVKLWSDIERLAFGLNMAFAINPFLLT